MVLQEIVSEVQNCATEDQPHGTGSPNTLYLSTPGLNIASHNTNAAMKNVQVNNNSQSPAPKKVCYTSDNCVSVADATHHALAWLVNEDIHLQ